VDGGTRPDAACDASLGAGASRQPPRARRQTFVARALAAAEPPSSGWAPTDEAVVQHYKKKLLHQLLEKLPGAPPAAAPRPSHWTAQGVGELQAAVHLSTTRSAGAERVHAVGEG